MVQKIFQKSSEINSSKVLEVKDLKVYYHDQKTSVFTRAVDGVGFLVGKGDCFAIVGESGSGKSTTAHCLLGLIEGVPGIIDGEIYYYPSQDDKDSKRNAVNLLEGLSKFTRYYDYSAKKNGRKGFIIKKNNKAWQKFFRNRMESYLGEHFSMIFQEHVGALNPMLTVGEHLEEVIRNRQRNATKKDIQNEMKKWMDEINLDPCIVDSFPEELSGGMSQRIMTALALANEPCVLISDEATTNLDAVTSKLILNLIFRKQKERNACTVLISHDLSQVEDYADEIMIMLKGKAVEIGRRSPFHPENPYWQHPYTQFLIREYYKNRVDKVDSELYLRDGGMNEEEGACPFYDKHLRLEPGLCCPGKNELPELRETGPGHFTRCFSIGE